MIVYSFKEEFRVIILLLCYAVSIGFTYDLLINNIKGKRASLLLKDSYCWTFICAYTNTAAYLFSRITSTMYS